MSMMTNDLEIEKYKQLLSTITELVEKMPEIILTKYFDKKKYLYALYFDAFNSVKAFCILIDNGCLLPQACSVLRMLIEQTATIRVLENNSDDLYQEYVIHQKIRFQIIDKDNNEKRELIKKEFKNSMGEKDNPIQFLEYGWLKLISDTYGLDELINLSKIQEDKSFINWKNQLNLWVHGSIKSANIFHGDNATIYCHQLIMIVAKLLDILICDFHNRTGFDFVINGVNYRNNFINIYKNIEDNK